MAQTVWVKRGKRYGAIFLSGLLYVPLTKLESIDSTGYSALSSSPRLMRREVAARRRRTNIHTARQRDAERHNTFSARQAAAKVKKLLQSKTTNRNEFVNYSVNNKKAI